jgi:hypothetical protein
MTRDQVDNFGTINRSVEHLTAMQAAAAGGIGSGISIATVLSVDPVAWAPWLQVATLTIGLLTGLASLALVVLKLIQQHRAMRKN